MWFRPGPQIACINAQLYVFDLRDVQHWKSQNPRSFGTHFRQKVKLSKIPPQTQYAELCLALTWDWLCESSYDTRETYNRVGTEPITAFSIMVVTCSVIHHSLRSWPQNEVRNQICWKFFVYFTSPVFGVGNYCFRLYHWCLLFDIEFSSSWLMARRKNSKRIPLSKMLVIKRADFFSAVGTVFYSGKSFAVAPVLQQKAPVIVHGKKRNIPGG